MQDEIKDIVINIEKQEEITFSPSFRIILAISIFLSGFLAITGIFFFPGRIEDKIWLEVGMNNFLLDNLFFLSAGLCFASLISISITKRPFSKILVWCVFSIGMLFIIASFVFTKIEGYECNFHIFSNGKNTLIDGTLLMVGLLGVLLSRVIHYGFIYQRNSDSTL